MPYTKEGIGYRNRDTSIAAAKSNIEGKLTLKEQAYNAIASSAMPLSADEIAEKIGRPFISVRPRITELANEGRICDSNKRGKTQWGKACILWSVV